MVINYHDKNLSEFTVIITFLFELFARVPVSNINNCLKFQVFIKHNIFRTITK